MSSRSIVLIGAGNVATHLAKALKKSQYPILQICSKHKASAKKLAQSLKCDYTTQLNEINPAADVYIIAVNDDAINGVAARLRLKNKIVVHTSGAAPISYLQQVSKNYGVFYPLQTFSKDKPVNFKTVPFCLEASNAATYKVLFEIASSISNQVQKINSEQRAVIHLAAVFACNFTNHFYAIAGKILSDNKLSLDILKPLIAETADKIQHSPPATVQTGPAIRGDKSTLQKHLALISDKQYKQLYRLVSKSIADFK